MGFTKPKFSQPASKTEGLVDKPKNNALTSAKSTGPMEGPAREGEKARDKEGEDNLEPKDKGTEDKVKPKEAPNIAEESNGKDTGEGNQAYRSRPNSKVTKKS